MEEEVKNAEAKEETTEIERFDIETDRRGRRVLTKYRGQDRAWIR